jgi:hypothetical protein
MKTKSDEMGIGEKIWKVWQHLPNPGMQQALHMMLRVAMLS